MAMAMLDMAKHQRDGRKFFQRPDSYTMKRLNVELCIKLYKGMPLIYAQKYTNNIDDVTET